MTSGSSWASAVRGWTLSTTSDPCVEARRRRLASGLVVPPGFLLAAPPVFLRPRHRCSCGCAAGVLAGCVAGVLAGCAPVFRAPSGPPAVRAASFARRVGSKPGQALRPRRHLPHWWRVVYVPSQGPSFPAIPSGLIRLFAFKGVGGVGVGRSGPGPGTRNAAFPSCRQWGPGAHGGVWR